MTIIILESVSHSLKGDLSKWLIEITVGVFVGKISKMVRDELWEKCVQNAKLGTVTMVWKTNTEQGFDLKSHNSKNYYPVDIEGIWLIRKP